MLLNFDCWVLPGADPRSDSAVSAGPSWIRTGA